jgi:hypothetical protein
MRKNRRQSPLQLSALKKKRSEGKKRNRL